ncbi:HdeA/HdeB family chaperone [Mesorhizobium sp. 10J20-29]
MRNLLTATSLAALLAAGSLGVAHAQSETGAKPTEQSASSSIPSERDAREITCRELTAMDRATVPGVLYFISGYSAGQESKTESDKTTAASGSNETSTVTAADADLPKPDASAATADDAADPNATASDNASSTDTSITASTNTAANSSASDDAGNGVSGNVQISVVRGFFDIPVEQTLVACGQMPDSLASDVINKQKDASK